jgi:hypothetical protein
MLLGFSAVLRTSQMSVMVGFDDFLQGLSTTFLVLLIGCPSLSLLYLNKERLHLLVSLVL